MVMTLFFEYFFAELVVLMMALFLDLLLIFIKIHSELKSEKLCNFLGSGL